jgi:hypothetical protein
MKKMVAETLFDCVSPDGNRFSAIARIGMPYIARTYAECLISFEPLIAERKSSGNDTFQAVCLAIDHIRKTLKSLVAAGGKVYFPGTKAPIDLNDPSFCPMNEFDWFSKKRVSGPTKRSSGRGPRSGPRR